jgi:hypothetical protein
MLNRTAWMVGALSVVLMAPAMAHPCQGRGNGRRMGANAMQMQAQSQESGRGWRGGRGMHAGAGNCQSGGQCRCMNAKPGTAAVAPPAAEKK